MLSARWPEASSAQNNIAAVSADGSTVWVLIRRLNSSCRRSIAFVVLRASPLARRQAGEGEEAVAGFLQAVGDGAVTEPPLADEGLAARLDLLGRGGVDHVGVVGGDLLVQALGRVGEQVAVLMDRAPLNRHAVPDRGDRLFQPRRAVDDEEVRAAQTASDQIVEHRTPGLGASLRPCS